MASPEAGLGLSRTTMRNSGAISSPAKPTTMKAARQSTRAATYPPASTPSAEPSGMPSEYTDNAKARRWLGK